MSGEHRTYNYTQLGPGSVASRKRLLPARAVAVGFVVYEKKSGYFRFYPESRPDKIKVIKGLYSAELFLTGLEFYHETKRDESYENTGHSD